MSDTAGHSYPFPIFQVAHRYYLYDIDVITFLRREQNILGVLSGSLPQSPQQNVFLGLPLQLLTEEARLLVEQGLGYIVDDVHLHRSGLAELSVKERQNFRRKLVAQGLDYSNAAFEQARAKKEDALEKLSLPKHNVAKTNLQQMIDNDPGPSVDDGSQTFFSPDTEATTSINSKIMSKPAPYRITPTTSYPPFNIATEKPLGDMAFGSSSDDEKSLPRVRSFPSYAVFRHLHSKSYFMSPGLRFGAQYSVYPGDPLRFHAHFLANGFDWDEEIDLLSLIGGGRLGTGVKKGYLIGGQVRPPIHSQLNSTGAANDTRCFCIEWAGM